MCEPAVGTHSLARSVALRSIPTVAEMWTGTGPIAKLIEPNASEGMSVFEKVCEIAALLKVTDARALRSAVSSAAISADSNLKSCAENCSLAPTDL